MEKKEPPPPRLYRFNPSLAGSNLTDVTVATMCDQCVDQTTFKEGPYIHYLVVRNHMDGSVIRFCPECPASTANPENDDRFHRHIYAHYSGDPVLLDVTERLYPSFGGRGT